MTSKHDDPRAVLARALLGSKNHRPRATVRCGHRRHRLAAVYLLPDGRRVLAVPSNKYLHKVLHLPHPDADPAEVVTSEAWTWDLDNPDADPAARIILRCQCRSFGTSIEDVRQQLDRLAPGDTWIMASMSMTADHPVTVESRRIRAAVLDHLAAAEDAGWPSSHPPRVPANPTCGSNSTSWNAMVGSHAAERTGTGGFPCTGGRSPAPARDIAHQCAIVLSTSGRTHCVETAS